MQILDVIILMIYGFIIFDVNHQVSAKDPKLCLKGSCIHSAHRLLLNMDLTVDPCQDFNKFSCGGFPKNNFVLEKHGEVNEFLKARDHLRKKVIRLFKEKKLPDGNIEFDTDEKIRNFYDGCKIFKRKRDKNQIFRTPFKSMLVKIGIADWPYTNDNWTTNNNTVEWYEIVANMMKEGLVVADGFIELPIVNVEVGINDFDEDFYNLKIDQPDFHSPFDRATLTNTNIDDLTPVITKLRDFVSSTLNLDSDAAYNALYKSVEIEKVLAAITDDSDNRRSVRAYGVRQDERNYSTSTIDDLPELPCSGTCVDGNKISWTDYIKMLFSAVDLDDVNVNATDIIIVKNIQYITNLKSKLDELNLSSMDWANYLGFKLLQTFQVAQENFNEEFENNCENYLIAGKSISKFGLLHGAVGSLYVRKYFNQEKKKDVENMVDYMKKGFKKCICENPSFKWMDSETQSAALEKIEAMEGDIGYPPELLNKTVVDSYYADLEIIGKDHFENVRALGKFKAKKTLEKLYKHTDDDHWTNPLEQVVSTVSAFYARWLNKVFIPAGILDGIFYDPDRPQYMNYGSIGAIVGHEMTHGFDHNGKYYDKFGEMLEPPGFWSENSNIGYENISVCIENQYWQFKAHQLPEKTNVNGTRTLNENLADIGGIRMAYFGYLEWLKDHGEEEILPGFTQFTPQQLFWISSAQYKCSKLTDEELREQIRSSEYPPWAMRNNGTAMSAPEFSKDFKCVQGSPMNPDWKSIEGCAYREKKQSDYKCGIAPYASTETDCIIEEIVGGCEANPHSIPWQVALLLNGEKHCGGTLISSQHVVTAAHCTEGKSADSLTVLIGEHDWSPKNTLKVAINEAHADFCDSYCGRVDYDNDIAILTLAEEVVFTDKIVPACLPGPDYHDYVGEELTISGWGNLGSYRGSADKLQVVKVPYVTNKICGGVETNYEPSELTDNMMCAGNITHGSIDTCQGDSGGPITHADNGKTTLVGVVSWGHGCAVPKQPGIYSRVSQYIDWIKEKTDGTCSIDGDCHEKKACIDGKCIYPCKRGTCNEDLEEKCSVENHKIICKVIRALNIPPQSKGEESSFLINCNGSCEGVDIKVTGKRYDTGFYLFALEEDKPTIDDSSYEASCRECENFCSTMDSYGNEKSCKNLSTSKDRFFVTVYAQYSHESLTIEFIGGNILNVSNIDCTNDTHCNDNEVCQIDEIAGICTNPCDSFENSCLQNQTCIITNRQPSCEYLEFIHISSKPESQELSFIVKCFDKCDQVDIRFSERETYFNFDKFSLYALENEKPKIENGSCPECENFCASQNGTACHDINTEGSKFYLTVYNDEPYVDSELALINVYEIIPFECHVDEHCKPKFTCSVNFTNFDEDKEVDGECIDPCLSFTPNCNNETETCIAKNHRPQCVGKQTIAINNQKTGEEQRLFVTCDGSCDSVNIKLIVEFGDPELLVLDHSQPEYSGFSCSGPTCCISTGGATESCSITTSLDSFYVLIYGYSSHEKGNITFENILTVEAYDCLSNEDCDEKERCEEKLCVNPCHDYDGCKSDGTFCKVVNREPTCFDGIEKQVLFKENEQLILKDKKQFLVQCLNESCEDVFADFTLNEGTAQFRVSTHLLTIPILPNSIAQNPNQFPVFHDNRICNFPNIEANKTVSCDDINGTSVSHFYVEIKNLGHPYKLEGSLRLINVENVTEGNCRSDEDCPYTRACIQNHCLDPCYTREYPEKQNCTTCFPQSHSPACEGGCFVRNHRPICEETEVTFTKYDREDGLISFTCDGDCTNDNITIHINAEENSKEDWAHDLVSIYGSPPQSLEIRTARDRVHLDNDLCDCKETMTVKYRYSNYDDWENVCRVWECFFKNNSLGESWVAEERQNYSFSDKLLQFVAIHDWVQDGYPLSIYLQGSKTIFWGECLVDRHCRSSEACMDQKCVDPCKNVNCTKYSDGKWCKTKNHQPSCSDECETETCSIVPSAESFYGDRACETCKFPFIYKGIKYETCTNVDQGPHSGGYWCSTQTFANGNHVTGSWGYCQDYCLQGLQESQQQCEYGDNTFYCKNGETTRCSFRCDGDNDCGDNSDEEPYVCPTNKKIKSNQKSNRKNFQHSQLSRSLDDQSAFSRLHQLHQLTNCGEGYKLDIAAETCVECPKGYYQDKPKQTFCQQCPTGTSTKSTRTSSENDCIKWH